MNAFALFTVNQILTRIYRNDTFALIAKHYKMSSKKFKNMKYETGIKVSSYNLIMLIQKNLGFHCHKILVNKIANVIIIIIVYKIYSTIALLKLKKKMMDGCET